MNYVRGSWRVVTSPNCVLLYKPGNEDNVHDKVLYPQPGKTFSLESGIHAAEAFIDSPEGQSMLQS